MRIRPFGPCRGFTLLEISAVVALVGLLTLLGLRPMKGYLRGLEFKNSAAAIKRLIQTAQSRAMGNPSVHVGVYFDLGANPNKAFLFEDKANPTTYQYDGAGDPAYLKPEVLKKGMRFEALSGQPDAIIFRGDGTAWKSMKICISDGARRDTLDVLASTGRVRLGR